MKTTAGTETQERCSHCDCNSTGGCAKCNPDLFKPISETFGIEYIKQKPKELEWIKEFDDKFVDTVKSIVDVNYSRKQVLSSPERLIKFIKQTLTQQRTELLEEIKKEVEDRIKHVNIFSTETGNRFKDDVIEIINLLNKKDEI